MSVLQQAADRQIGAAIIFFEPEGDVVNCLIDLPLSLEGTVFSGLVQVGDDFFAETVEGERIPMGRFESEYFERAVACKEQFFEVGIHGSDAKPERYPVRFTAEVQTFGMGV